MGRTRLVALCIGDLRIAIEAPPALPWGLARERLEAFAVPAEGADLHLGVRVGRVDQSRRPCLAEAGRERLEVHRQAGGWQILHRRGGRVEREARLDRELRTGEVILDAASPSAQSCRYPLAVPLDEWIVRHRLARAGGLLLTGCVGVRDGRATLFFGNGPVRLPGLAAALARRRDAELLAHGIVAVCSDATGFRVHATPWSYPEANRSARLEALHRVESGPVPSLSPLDTREAVASLCGACPSLDDPGSAEASLRTLERLAERVPCTRARTAAAPPLLDLVFSPRIGSGGRRSHPLAIGGL